MNPVQQRLERYLENTTECPCGSGKRWKKCHGSHARHYPPNAVFREAKKQGLTPIETDILRRISQWVYSQPVEGGCHLISAFAYCALKNVSDRKVEIYTGCYNSPFNFGIADHSWVTLDGCIIDLSIDKPYDSDNYAGNATVMDIDTKIGIPTPVIYGVPSFLGLDAVTTPVIAQDLKTFILGLPPEAYGPLDELIPRIFGELVSLDDLLAAGDGVYRTVVDDNTDSLTFDLVQSWVF